MPYPTGLASREHSHSFDILAFQELEHRASSARAAFELDVIEKALDDLVKNPKRAASGKRLADNLRRTAWTKLFDRQSDHSLNFEGSIPGRPIVPFKHEVDEAQEAASIIELAVDALPGRQRAALFLDIQQIPHQEAGRRLGISDRQFRNLAAAARRSLNENADAAEAFGDLAAMFGNQPSLAIRSLTPAFQRWGLTASVA